MPIDPKEFYTPNVQAAQLTGMIKTREPATYSARLRIPVGIATAAVMEGVAAASRTFGRGEVYLTARLGMEIPGIRAEDFPALRDRLAEFGVTLAGCGPRMRSTVACKGSVCPHGNVDTFAVAWKIDQQWNDGAVLPHKFKVAVSGCASSCVKPQTNDVGLVGVSEPELDPGPCVGCGLCLEACHLGAVRLEGDLPVFHPSRCVHCGDCAKACPTGALKPVRVGLDLYLGGRWGRERQVGLRVATFLFEEEAIATVGRVKNWYAEQGRNKERLGQTMLRVGPEACQAAVLEGVTSERWAPLTADALARFQVSR